MAYSAQRLGEDWIAYGDSELQEIVQKWSKNATAEIRAALQRPIAIANATAHHIRDRAMRGQFANPAQPYSERASAGPKKHKSYYISPAYAAAAGLGEQTRFRSSAEMHRATGSTAGQANVTGGMWAGLQVRNFGSDAAVIEFAGSSLGTKSTLNANSFATKDADGNLLHKLVQDKQGRVVKRQVRTLARDEGGNVKYRRKPRLERNNLKAFAVFQHLGVGLLEPRQDEVDAIWAAFSREAGLVITGIAGAHYQGDSAAGNPALFGAIVREFRKG